MPVQKSHMDEVHTLRIPSHPHDYLGRVERTWPIMYHPYYLCAGTLSSQFLSVLSSQAISGLSDSY